MTPSPFKSLLSQSEPVDLIWMSLGSVALAELAAHAAPAAIVLDLQHGLWERSALEAAVGIAGSRVPVVARCAANTPYHISQALDSGVSSVLIPLVETANEAMAAVSAGRYPPAGSRSAGGVRPLLAGVDNMLRKGEGVALGVMIETARGVENAEAIAAVPGLDYLFIGTGDLALSLGGDPSALEQACARILKAAQANGLPCGLYTRSVQAAQERFKQGYRLVVSANDVEIAKAGFAAAKRAVQAN
jgi:2-dehydro-3-deoxyglucarate aldolase/4-hydroxy-2-oxoheptanedioate aldolase